MSSASPRTIGAARHTLSALLLAFAAALSSGSCTEGTVPPEALDLVVAVRDTAADFASLRTFAMPDTVIHLADVVTTIDDVPISRAYDDLILASVARNFEARGYVRESNPRANRPDFIVLVAAVASDHFVAYTTYPWYSWWGFYPGFAYYPGFDPAYGIFYPWAGSVGGYAWTQGTVIADAIDARVVDTDEKQIRSLWVGALNGVLSGSGDATARLESGIDDMFTLSPYLRR
jgi:hypothetical protein